jgi:GNAT superfamily N-acetyltransferase
MDDETLQDLEHENCIEAIAMATRSMVGALVRREDGVAVLLSGHPLLLFNQIMIETAIAPVGALAAAIATARERGHRFVVDLRGGRDDRFIGTVTDLGLVPLDGNPWMPGMAMHPIPRDVATPAPDPTGVLIRRVHDAAGMADHIRAAAAGFEMPDELLRDIVSADLLAQPAAALYVGYVDGEPAVSGLGIRTERTIGVYNIATVQSARRRGFGAAMTARIVADGAAAGCDVAILQASEMGRPIYERMGFRTVVEYLGYVEPTASDTAG